MGESRFSTRRRDLGMSFALSESRFTGLDSLGTFLWLKYAFTEPPYSIHSQQTRMSWVHPYPSLFLLKSVKSHVFLLNPMIESREI